ncbi:MAG: ABC transporter substrate-binding protein, partial [Bacillota bacterium]
MKKNRLLTALVALILVFALIGVVACGKKETATPPADQAGTATPAPTKTLKVGFIMPMSGGGSLWGTNIKKDCDAYAQLINDQGGLKIGEEYYNIETYYADDQGLPDKAAPATNDLIDNHGVSAILGYWAAGLPTINNIITPKKVLYIGGGSTNYDPKTMPYVAFSFDNRNIGFVQLESIINAFPNTKKLGSSINDVFYGMSTDKEPAMIEMLKEKGIEYYVDVYAIGASDYTTHIEKLQKAGVDTIFSAALPQESAMKQKEIYARNWKVNYADAGTIPDLKSYMGISGYDAAQGGLHPFDYPWDFKLIKVAPDIVKLAQDIRDEHQKMLGEPQAYSGAYPYGLNSMLMYFEAMQKAGTTDPDKVMAAIDGGTFDLFTGTYKLGGLKSEGRAVFAPPTGSMGRVEG